MNSDFRDLLRLFAVHEVRYLVVGGYAAMHYSQPRFTKDLDLWLEPTPTNAQRVIRAFSEFGMPLIDVTPEDFSSEGLQYMVGRAPSSLPFSLRCPVSSSALAGTSGSPMTTMAFRSTSSVAMT